MNDLLVALLLGTSLAFLIFACRDPLVARFRKDVAWLEHARWRMSPESFDGRKHVAIYYVSAALSLSFILFMPRFKFIAFALWLIAVVLPRIIINGQWARRCKLINDQLPAAVLQMSSSVASGMSLAQATEHLSERAPHPISVEFQVMKNYWSMGSDFPATLEEARRRLQLQDFNLFSSALLINLRMGGDITHTLQRLAHSLEAVEKMRRDVEVATAQGRMNIKVLCAAPVIMLLFICVIDLEAVGWLFTKPIGQIILVIAGALIATGVAWAWSIVNSDV